MGLKVCPNCGNPEVRGASCDICNSFGSFYPFEALALLFFIILAGCSVMYSLNSMSGVADGVVSTPQITPNTITAQGTNTVLIPTLVIRMPSSGTVTVQSEPIASISSTVVPIANLKGKFIFLSQELGASHFVLIDKGSSKVLSSEKFTSLSQPVWNPKGSHFTFSGVKNGAREIYLATVSGNSCQLSESGAPSSYSVWHSDSKQVAYLQGRQIKVVTASCEPRSPGVPLPIPDQITAFDWSSHNILVYIRADATQELTFYDLTFGSSQTSSLKLGGIVTSPRWSPTGNRVAFIMKSERGEGLYILDVATLVARPVFTGEQIASLSWSPSEDALIFVSKELESSSLFLYNVKENMIQPVTADVTNVKTVSWGP